MSQEKKYRRATVYWDDTWSSNNTHFAKDFSAELLKSCPMKSTGWVVAQDKERVALVFELDWEGDTRRTQTIARKMITRIEYLEPVKKK